LAEGLRKTGQFEEALFAVNGAMNCPTEALAVARAQSALA
jgi:hypothetical protein